MLLGALLGGMMSIDMGGPINKAAYLFGTASLATMTEGSFEIMASVMIGGMVAPACHRFVHHLLSKPVHQERAPVRHGQLCDGPIFYH